MVQALPALIEPPATTAFGLDTARPDRTDGGGFVETLRAAADDARASRDAAPDRPAAEPEDRGANVVDRGAEPADPAERPESDDTAPRDDVNEGDAETDAPAGETTTEGTTEEPTDAPADDAGSGDTPAGERSDAPATASGAVQTIGPVAAPIGGDLGTPATGTTTGAVTVAAASTPTGATSPGAEPAVETGRADAPPAPTASTAPSGSSSTTATASPEASSRAGAGIPVEPVASGARSGGAAGVAVESAAPSAGTPVVATDTDSQPQGRSAYRDDSSARTRLEATAERGPTGAGPAAGRAHQVDQAVRLEQQALEAGGPSAGRGPSGAAPESPRPAAPTESASLRAATTREPEGPPLRAQAIRGLTAMINQRGGAMTMRLQPPELGQLRVQMQIHQGRVSAQIQASSVQAHMMLERDIGSLRSALESSGLDVERLHVHPPPGGHGASAGQSDGDAPDGGRGRHDAAGGESRGRGSHGPGHGGRDLDDRAFDELVEALGQGDAAPTAAQGATHR